MFPTINRELMPIKAHYFLFNAATGPIVPFLPTIARQLGFSGILVGTIYTVLPISGLIAKPLFGSLADKFKLHKTFFLVFQALLTISLFTIHFIPEVDKAAKVALTCDQLAYLQVCSEKGFSQNVMDSVISNTIHSNSSCHVSCEGFEKAYKELCDHWKAVEFCNYANNTEVPEQFNFTIGFDKYHDVQINRCVDIQIKTATFLGGGTYVPYCSQLVRTRCIAKCSGNPAFNQLLRETDTTPVDFQSYTYQFQLFLWSAVVGWIGMAVVVSIADAICFDILGTDRRKEYGKQKLWGSIGFGIFGISAGYLVDVFSIGQVEKDYTCIFYLMLVAMIFDLIVSTTIRKKNPECSEENPSILRELRNVSKEGNVLVFGWWCIGAGMCTGVVWNFLFWYTEDLATGSQVTWLKTLQGLLTGVQCFLGELPFNFISGSVLKKFGHVNVMSFVLLVYAIRFMAYTVVTNPWWFLLIELLHGPSLGFCWPTMVSYADKITPPGTKGTMQGLIGAVFEGIGVASGSLICGWLMESYGGVTTLRVFSVGALLWLTGFWLMQLCLRKIKSFQVHQGHNHLTNYANPDDAILMTMSQELQTY